MKQVPTDPRKTKRQVSKLHIDEGERTEIAINERTDDVLTNGASDIIKFVKLHQPDKPSRIIWVQIDQQDVATLSAKEQNKITNNIWHLHSLSIDES